MAIDLNALRAKHEQLSNPKAAAGGNNQDFLNKFYRVQEGDNYVRILPASEGSDKPFYAETKIHRVPDGQGGVRNYHCRKVHGEKCPMCELYYALWKTGVKEDEDLARQIKPRSRYYLNVLDRNTDEVKIFSIGMILFQKIMETMLDPDYADLFEKAENGILDTKIGHDFKVSMFKEGQWPKYDRSMFRPRGSELGSAQQVDEVMNSLHDIHDLVKLEEYDTLMEAAQNLRPELGVVRERPAPSQETPESGSDDDFTRRLMS